MNKFRQRIINKLAQTQPAQPVVTPPVLSPPQTVPTILFSHLNEGYNGATVSLLTGLIEQINIAMHYVSNGKDNFEKIIGNNLDLSGAAQDQKNIDLIAKKLYNTFFNNKNSFIKKIDSQTIKNWADGILNSTELSNLSKINPTGILSTKLQGNIKTIITNYLNQIKSQNP